MLPPPHTLERERKGRRENQRQRQRQKEKVGVRSETELIVSGAKLFKHTL